MSTCSDLALETTAVALLMMAQTAFYVPRELPLPSFSLGLTDSSQEETQTQEGVGQPEPRVKKSLKTTMLIEELDVLVEKIAKSGEKTSPDFPEGKSPPTEKQTVCQIFDKFKTPARRNLMSAEMKEKCYLLATRIGHTQMTVLMTMIHFAHCTPNNRWGSYDCAIYVMKLLEINESQNAEVDHFRVEFVFQILFHDINRDRDTAIKGSEAMRLSKPSAALLSPYCQVDSYDIAVTVIDFSFI
ncbi:hypothetical protein Ahy_A10g050962 [Arachis hypogaea]|uniref:Uncharacterized protein n=1 Tax=Arachis hypogaea TaxID=3818 RepID=A0A445BB32_ARAHY|nr:hypothetical protein Ahy_A10g050962 [Arachis hypogaea]